MKRWKLFYTLTIGAGVIPSQISSVTVDAETGADAIARFWTALGRVLPTTTIGGYMVTGAEITGMEVIA